jgi:protein-L-isoaspartate(D-aspartate) O-methyltransferase
LFKPKISNCFLDYYLTPFMNIELARFNMIQQQIRTWNVLDESLLSLLHVVKREEFVPPALTSLAFNDMELPLAGGHMMLAPKLEARLLQELQVQKHERVLLIGVGSGYLAALLGHKAQQVYAVEIDPQMLAFAQANLVRARAKHIELIEGDGSQGLQSEAPFDAILLSGSVAYVPDALLDQLKVGGRLLGIMGNDPIMQAVLIKREAQNKYDRRELFDTIAPRLINFPETEKFVF